MHAICDAAAGKRQIYRRGFPRGGVMAPPKLPQCSGVLVAVTLDFGHSRDNSPETASLNVRIH
jgi:hypothetical protein